MEYPLQFGRQTWKPRRDGELTLFLPSNPRYGVFFNVQFQFVPPWLGEEDYESEHRKMHLELHGHFRGLNDWRDLEGFEAEGQEAVEELGEVVTPEIHGPEIEIWSSGTGPASIHTHARDGWETRLKLGKMMEEEYGYVFLCELEAFFPSERAREVCAELWMRQFFSELEFDDEEKAKLLEEGWRFRYRGRVGLDQLSCTVPLNTADPIGWAQRMAERELRMKRFGLCRVNGGELDGSFKPEDGVCCDGRLVLLSPPSAWYTEFLRRQQETKPKKNEGEAGK